MSDEWGPWIEHDGDGCPCVGQYVNVEIRSGDVFEVIAGEECAKNGVDPNGHRSAWVWTVWPARSVEHSYQEVVRYRIRKPRGMTILQDLIENLPVPQRETEDA